MKNISETNENNANNDKSNSYDQVTDSLLNSKGGQSLDCNKVIDSNGLINGDSMGHKSRCSHRNLLKTQESRSQSLPNSLDVKNQTNGYVSDSETCLKLLPESDSPPESPTTDLWFKTWPERNKNAEADESTCPNSSNCDSRSEQKSKQNTFTLNEALQSISLAYSPVTKQLHYIEKNEEVNAPEENKTKLGHRRTEAGSFSSTVSSLSDPSPSGSLLDADDRTYSPESEFKSKRKGLSSFFNRSVFAWGSISSMPEGPSGWKIFGKRGTDQVADVQGSPKRENIVASSTALIQHIRPSHLPAKDLDEEQRHRDEYRAMVAAAKRREAKNSAAKQRQQRQQLQAEEQLATATKYWNTHVLHKWDCMHKTKKTRDFWWQGLPSSVRGKVWRLAIGNDLNLTQQLYEICLTRAQARLSNSEPIPNHTDDVNQESSMDLIKLDIARTFPNLCIFQEGGPYSEILHTLLAAYVCYRPDVGYVQGMSFVAAILILNMEHFDAFVCFANLLNRPLHLAAFTLNQRQMQAYYSAYNELFEYNLPKLYSHFENSGLTPDLYLLDWVYTMFSKAMPLDVACRIWDVFLRDGDEFVFRTALGVLHLHQELLQKMDFIHGAQFLTKLPEDLSADCLFKSIQAICVSIGKVTFSQIVDKFKDS